MTGAPMEELVRQVLDRLARQERRTEALEAALLRPAGAGAGPWPTASSAETLPEIPWPRRELPADGLAGRTAARASGTADRVRELEARMAEAEERLRQSAGLETVGRLAAGVAHDFNNLLTVISGSAEVIRGGLPDGDELRDAADLIVATTQTAAGVARQLVSLGRPGLSEPCAVDLNTAIRAVERTLRRLVGERVTLDVTLAPAIPLVRADPGQFDRVLLNLVVNARDAVAAGAGTITIRTAAATGGPDRPGWPAEVPAGEFVAVTVTDTGCGMSDEVKARIFDPFFTTKGPRGTGLGLSTVRDIVRGVGGHIEVESSPGWGTSIRVFWPAFADTAAPVRLLR